MPRKTKPPRLHSRFDPETVVGGCALLWIAFCLALTALIVYVIAHFVIKAW